ncbi:MAG: peptide-methionine (R)-S-oxide reductase MsrB [Actinomycetota bacterium]
MAHTVVKSEQQWRRDLTAEQYKILREKGTERPFTGALLDNKKSGMYTCGGCGAELFPSDAKFDSGTGWPSFTQPVADGRVELKPDNSYFMRRTEVLCGACGGHLGHVFNDGPSPTGQRYCINSCSLRFEEAPAS